MSEACGFSLVNAAVQLAGVGLGGIVGFLSARSVSSRNGKVVAAAKLRAAFAPALAQMEIDRNFKSTHDRPDTEGILGKAVLGHAAAIEEFRPFVASNKLANYQLAWERYFRSLRDHTVNSWDPATTSPGEHEWHVVVNSINSLLAYAET